MKRRTFLDRTIKGGLIFIVPFDSKLFSTEVENLKFIGTAIRWLANLFLSEVVGNIIFDRDCNCPSQDLFWVSNEGVSYNGGENEITPKSLKAKLPNNSIAAFGYSLKEPSGAKSYNNRIFKAKVVETNEIAMLIPEAAIFSICCIANTIYQNGWINAESKNELNSIKELLMPVSDNFTQSVERDSMIYKSKIGTFEFQGHLVRSSSGKAKSVFGKVILQVDNAKDLDPTTSFILNQFPMDLDEETGNLDFLG